MLVNSRWFWGGDWLWASLWLALGGLCDANVGQTEKILDRHHGSVLGQKGKRVILPDRCGQSGSRSVGGTYDVS